MNQRQCSNVLVQIKKINYLIEYFQYKNIYLAFFVLQKTLRVLIKYCMRENTENILMIMQELMDNLVVSKNTLNTVQKKMSFLPSCELIPF